MNRKIRKSGEFSKDEAKHLLGSLFSLELANPSTCIWIVAPWVSDIDIIDNTAGGFPDLDSFGNRWIKLSEVLVSLAERRTTVVVAVSAEGAKSTAYFLRRLQRLFKARELDEQLIVHIDETKRLHEKAITADDYLLDGSMNFTFNGVEVRSESLELHTNPSVVREARMTAYERFGGKLDAGV